MKYFLPYLASFVLLTSLESTAQKNILTERTTNTIQRDFKKILIVGSGVVESHAFLDMLTDKIISKMKKEGIETSYSFFGKDTSEVNNQIKQIDPGSYDAVIIFQPVDSSNYSDIKYHRTGTVASIILGVPNHTVLGRNVEVEQLYEVQLYDPKKSKDIIWSATLQVDCDLSKSSQITEMSKNIISSFKSNKILK